MNICFSADKKNVSSIFRWNNELVNNIRKCCNQMTSLDFGEMIGWSFSWTSNVSKCTRSFNDENEGKKWILLLEEGVSYFFGYNFLKLTSLTLRNYVLIGLPQKINNPPYHSGVAGNLFINENLGSGTLIHSPALKGSNLVFSQLFFNSDTESITSQFHPVKKNYGC